MKKCIPFASCTPQRNVKIFMWVATTYATSASPNYLETSRRVSKNDALRNSRESRVSDASTSLVNRTLAHARLSMKFRQASTRSVLHDRNFNSRTNRKLGNRAKSAKTFRFARSNAFPSRFLRISSRACTFCVVPSPRSVARPELLLAFSPPGRRIFRSAAFIRSRIA